MTHRLLAVAMALGFHFAPLGLAADAPLDDTADRVMGLRHHGA